MPTTAFDAVSPELVLVSPDLRVALQAAFLADRASSRDPAVRPAGAAAPPAHDSLALAAGAYATQRLAWVIVQGAVLVLVLVLILGALSLTHA